MSDPTWPGHAEPTLPGGPAAAGSDGPTWPGAGHDAPTWPGTPGAVPPVAPGRGSGPPPIPPVAPIPPVPAPRSAPGPARRPAGARTAIGVLLLFVAGLSAVGAFTAAWTRSQVRDEDTWALTAQALADDPEVQQAVADVIAVQVISLTGADDLISGVLPGPLGGLADPLTEGATELVSVAALELVQTEAFQSAWETAVRNAHQELLAALDGDGRFTAVTSQGVVLDLGSTLGQFRQLLDDRGLTILDGIDLSGIDIQVLLLDAPGVQSLGDILDALDVLVVVLPIVAGVTAVLGLVIARRRSWAVVAAGAGVLVGAGAVWVLVQDGESRAVDQVSGGVLGPSAVRVVADHVVSALDGPLAAAAVVGVVIAVVGLVGAVATARRA